MYLILDDRLCVHAVAYLGSAAMEVQRVSGHQRKGLNPMGVINKGLHWDGAQRGIRCVGFHILSGYKCMQRERVLNPVSILISSDSPPSAH